MYLRIYKSKIETIQKKKWIIFLRAQSKGRRKKMAISKPGSKLSPGMNLLAA